MPATFVVQSINPENGMRKVLLTLMHLGNPNYIQVDVAPAVLAMIFGEDDVKEGDTRSVHFPLVSRGETNGLTPSPLSRKI